ncbi:MAG: DNA mismatch repair protein MutS [Puniceicoccales bacterium]|jgi:DNA mismatch repair protein MutS|nr:DNA mismatch repair protein MutS [Puniceicoccales bacterium]
MQQHTSAQQSTIPKDPKTTPMMASYWAERQKLPDDVLLLYRVGDFYEMFDRDAELGARALSITLTKRAGLALAGVPYHAIQTYVPRLLAAGYRVAICEQMEVPRAGKPVRRALSRILSPGTAIEDNQLEAIRNNYLLAICGDRRAHALHAAWIELSTGEFRIAAADPESLLPVLAALDPREVLVPDEDPAPAWAKLPSVAAFLGSRPVNKRPAWQFETDTGARAVADALGVLNLQGFGVAPEHPALGPAGAVLAYATDSLCQKPANLSRLSEYQPSGALVIDAASQRNLELFRGSGGTRAGSLLETLDATVTAPGARLLGQWLAMPPCAAAAARARQSRVTDLVRRSGAAARLREKLSGVRDIARILSRLQNRIRNPRELGGIRDTLRLLPEIRAELADEGLANTALAALAAGIHPCEPLRDRLASALADELPADIADGGVLRDGYDDELDRLRKLSRKNKTWVNDLEAAERASTGIKTLRIIYNGAFGYMIEVTKNNAALAPAHYIRRQTLTNYERYTTDDLKKKEQEILRADENAGVREQELYNTLVEEIRAAATPLAATAATLAELDIYCGWAAIAREWDYCAPVVDDSDALEIEQGRHPVVEQMLRKKGGGAQTFVPNDTFLQASGETGQVALLTGPNMAGKSTYIRQVALIALMAQLGCWVPARRARVGVVDRLFCRVGASDELARGNSTFMVEMNETANILNNATASSLVILDEIGRGTSTYDGISIAWAVAEYLHGAGPRGPRTLFATHYHELTRLQTTLPRLRNYCVAVKEWNDEIIFVRQVIPGAADRSYGIHVARLAGMPAAVVSRANEILTDMESGGVSFMEGVKNDLQKHEWKLAAPVAVVAEAGAGAAGAAAAVGAGAEAGAALVAEAGAEPIVASVAAPAVAPAVAPFASTLAEPSAHADTPADAARADTHGRDARATHLTADSAALASDIAAPAADAYADTPRPAEPPLRGVPPLPPPADGQLELFFEQVD